MLFIELGLYRLVEIFIGYLKVGWAARFCGFSRKNDPGVYNEHVIDFGDSLGDFHILPAELWAGEKSALVSNFHLTQKLQ